RCPAGEARITPGFRLPARFVIHTVGPVYRGAASSAPLLEKAYRSSLELADREGVRSIAFPAISCGVYGYPLDEAAPIAIATCREHVAGIAEIRFALFGEDAYDAFLEAAERLLTA
ncbi:MAG TPA: macro domain-containing protein, partial [Planctomycetota bacterium]|nr:macro domain-containing protein [Planctomycetota bacterium]